MQNNEHMETQTDEKMKAQTTRQTARKTGISNWYKNFFQIEVQKTNLHIEFHSRNIEVGRCS